MTYSVTFTFKDGKTITGVLDAENVAEAEKALEVSSGAFRIRTGKNLTIITAVNDVIGIQVYPYNPPSAR